MCSYQGSTQEIRIPLLMFLSCSVVVRTFLVLEILIRTAESMSKVPLNLRSHCYALPTTSTCPIFCAPLSLGLRQHVMSSS